MLVKLGYPIKRQCCTVICQTIPFHRSLYVIFIHTMCLECMQYLSSALHSSKAINHTCASHMKPNYFSNFQVLFTLNKDYTNGSTSLSCFMYVKQLYVRREYSALPKGDSIYMLLCYGWWKREDITHPFSPFEDPRVIKGNPLLSVYDNYEYYQ